MSLVYIECELKTLSVIVNRLYEDRSNRTARARSEEELPRGYSIPPAELTENTSAWRTISDKPLASRKDCFAAGPGSKARLKQANCDIGIVPLCHERLFTRSEAKWHNLAQILDGISSKKRKIPLYQIGTKYALLLSLFSRLDIGSIL